MTTDANVIVSFFLYNYPLVKNTYTLVKDQFLSFKLNDVNQKTKRRYTSS
jgi:hypothetical protein